jgi:hypothetical protein
MEQKSSLRVIPIVVAVVALIALAWSTRYDWSDNVHVRYGLPLTWGTHTLVTIAGPANIWRVDFVNLILDLVLWLALIREPDPRPRPLARLNRSIVLHIPDAGGAGWLARRRH